MNTNLKTKYLQHFIQQKHRPIGVLSLMGLVGAVALGSCGANMTPTSQLADKQMQVTGNSMPPSQPAPATEAMAGAPSGDVTVATGKLARSLPQLIKRAELNLLVKSIDASMKEVSAIAQKQQGDIMGFQDSKPQDPSIRATASMQIRVPQQKLQIALDQLAKLGTVQNRSLTAEDVSDQLVDIDARLRNLRKAEELTVKIMERSGSVGDVLKASKELSNIRESIERLDAQQRNLRNQVAYSTINLSLEAAVSGSVSAQPSLGVRMQETWGQATNSVSELTLGLLAFSIWLFAFSPYLILGGAAIYGYRRFIIQRKSLPADRQVEQPASKLE